MRIDRKSESVVEKAELNMLRRAEELGNETADLFITGCVVLEQGETHLEVTAHETMYAFGKPV